jgi:hypothetical protein
MPINLRRSFQLGAAAAAFGLLFLLTFGLPGNAGETTDSMQSSEIEKQIIGKKLDWKSLDGSLDVYGQITFSRDGKVVMTTNLPGLPADEGQWWFDQNRICTRWAAARDGEAKCYHVMQQGGGRFTTTGGNLFELGADPMV